MRTEIIIPAWNRLEYTISCIRRLWWTTRQEKPSLCVVDQGSTDGTREWLATNADGFYGPIRVVRHEENIGELDGLLAAAETSTAELLVLWNNDMYALTADWLSRLLAAHRLMEVGFGRVVVSCSWIGCWNTRQGKKVSEHAELISHVPAAGACLIRRATFLKASEKRQASERPNTLFAQGGLVGVRVTDAWCVHMNSSHGQTLKHPTYFLERYGKLSPEPEKPCIDENGGEHDWHDLMDDSGVTAYDKLRS